MDTETVAAVIRWSGVIVALAGAVLTSPDGTKSLWGAAVLATKRLFGRVGEDVNIPAPTAYLGGEGNLNPGGVPRWGPGASVEERIDILLARVEKLTTDLAEMKSELNARLDRHDKLIAKLTKDLYQARLELHQLITAKEKRSAQIDAFGLPVIGLGIFLVGVPSDLALVPPLGISLSYISLYVTFFVALLSIRRGAWSGKLA